MFKTLRRIANALERQADALDKQTAISEKTNVTLEISSRAAIEGWKCHNEVLEVQKKMSAEQDKINADYFQFKNQFLTDVLEKIQVMDLDSAEKLIRLQMEQK